MPIKGVPCGIVCRTSWAQTAGRPLKDLTESVGFIVKDMATKDDIADLRTELKGDIFGVQSHVNSIERQLRETKTEVRLGALEDKVFGAPRH